MIHRHFRIALLAAAATVAGTGLAQAQDALTAPQVRAQLEAQGYTKVHDIKFDDGMWEADATSADGKRVDLRLDPRTGTVYPDTAVSQLSEADIRAQLSTAGYSDVHDVEFDDGLWEAEVRGKDGRWHDVAVDGASGELMDDRGGRALLPAADITAALTAAGYRDIHDLDLDDAVWEADATNAQGQRVELRLNAHTGKVLSESIDD